MESDGAFGTVLRTELLVEHRKTYSCLVHIRDCTAVFKNVSSFEKNLFLAVKMQWVCRSL